jgi:hypothetical protein
MEMIIPTNDSINIAPEFEEASGFRFLTIINGSIKSDSLNQDKSDFVNNIFPFLTAKKATEEPNATETVNPGSVCRNPLYQKYVLVSAISQESERELSENNFVVLKTTEVNIINAVMHHIEKNTTIESDYCCNP